jgi:hypothetical protein
VYGSNELHEVEAEVLSVFEKSLSQFTATEVDES